MRLYKVNSYDLTEVVNAVSKKHYNGNLTFNRLDVVGNHVEFTLRVNSSKGPGHRLGHNGRRRLTSACWHAHYDVMSELFRRFPEAKLVTAMASYDGALEFRTKHRSTATRNAGSMMNPVAYSDLCECNSL